MAKIKYRCDDNGHEFDGNDFTNECPTCGSSVKAISTGSGIAIVAKIKEFVANNKLVVGVIALLILFLFIYNNIDDTPNETYIIRVNPNSSNPYLEIEIISQGGENNKASKVDPKRLLSIIENKVKITGTDKFIEIKENNRLYLCAEDTADAIYFTFTAKPNKVLKKDKASSSFHLYGISESPEANCAMQPLKSSEVIVDSEKDCKLRVTIKRDLQGRNIFVSVDGQHGHYELNKTHWERKPLVNKKQNVWVFFEGSDESTAVAATGNGNDIEEAGCVPIDITKVKNEFITLANAFGKDPQDRPAQMAFQSFVNKKFTHTVIYLNNDLMDDLSDLQNKMRVIATRDSKQFRLQGDPDISQDGSTITFRFQEY